MTNKKEYKILRKVLSLTLAMLVSILGLPLAKPQQASATEASEPKYLSDMTITATASTTWSDEGKYNGDFYKEIIEKYDTYTTAETALKIDSADKLAAFAKVVNDTTDEAKDKDFSGKYVKLTAPIDLKGGTPTVTKTPSGDKFNISVTNPVGQNGEAIPIENVWVPIGTFSNRFKGTFDGNECEVRNMTVLLNNANSGVYAGLFGCSDGGSIKDTGVKGNVCIFASSYDCCAGGLVGESYSSSSGSSITDSYATVNVYASSSSSNHAYAGGLVGSSNKASISNSYATGNVYAFSASSSAAYAGGLVGYISSSSISNSYATGNVYAFSSSASVYAGGLVGESYSSSSGSSITDSYATGNASAASSSVAYAGGLVGYFESSSSGKISIINSYATGNVYAFSSSSSTCASGLVGYFYGYGSTINNSYATGNVSASSSKSTCASGLVGYFYGYNNTINNSYATGNAYASSSSSSKVYAGGLVGDIYNSNSITDSYYYSGATIDVPSGKTPSSYGTGLTKDQMTGTESGRAPEKMQSLKDSGNWDFNDDVTGVKYLPRLKNITYVENSNPAPRFPLPFTASDFDFGPTNLTYDGTPKGATVTAKSGVEGIGEITAKYYDSKGNQITGLPTDAGKYTVKIDFVEGNNDATWKGITFPSWTFTIEKAELKTDYFTFTPPVDNRYNGSKISPTVEVNGISDIGNITLKYYKLQVEDGKLVVLDPTSEAPTDVATYGVSIDVPESSNYKSATNLHPDWKTKFESGTSLEDLPWTFSILLGNPADPGAPGTNNRWPYGNPLATWELSPAGWKWVKPDEVPTVGNSGYKVYYSIAGTLDKYDWTEVIEKGGYTLKQAEGSLPDRLETTVSPSVDPAIPKYTKPENLKATYGQTLANVALSTLYTGWSWLDETQSVGDVGTHQFKANFTQFKEGTTEADENFKTVTDMLDVEVKKADPKCFLLESISATYGQKLNDLNDDWLVSPEGYVPGTWAWVEGDQLVGDATETGREFDIKFTPKDSDNYNEVNKKLTVIVKKANLKASDFDFEASNVAYDGKEKTANITLKSGIVGAGEITSVEYYKDGSETPLQGLPTSAGTYKVKINVSGGNNYNGAVELSSANWIFRIDQDFPENPVTPTPKAVKYGTKLSEITLDDGWNWVDDTIETTVENQGYMAYYDVEDDTNYDWSNIEGYNPELHRVERTLKLTVFVDKSDWGEEVKNNDELNYVDKDGTTSTEVVKKDVTWVKEESDGTSAWYGLDNSEGEFELGSRFWVRWLNKEKEEWEYYYNNLDEKHKNAVDSGRLWIFLAGVTAPNGQEYEGFNKEVKFYIQLGEDWDKEDINAVFISSGEDEILDVSYVDDISSPAGTQEFARLTLKHFSPYAVYDNLTDEERAALMESKNKNEANSDEDNVMYRVWSLFTTGDTATPLLLTGLAVLVIASGATLIFLKKKRKK